MNTHEMLFPVDKKTCQICGSASYQRSNRMYRKCQRCGHERREDFDQEGFESVQKKMYEDDNSYYFSPLMKHVSTVLSKERVKVLKKFLAYGRLLEIGPGSGEFIDAVSKADYSIEAIEHSAIFYHHLLSKTNGKIHHGLLENFDNHGVVYDCLVSFHVLEHVLDPLRHLSRLGKLIKPGGFLMLATPNASSWDRKAFKSRWTGYSPGHINLFSLQSIQLCIKKIGFNIMLLRTCEQPMALAWSIKSSIKPVDLYAETSIKAGSIVSGVPLKLGLSLLFLFGLISKPLRIVQECFNGGNELFIVAQKN